MPSGSVRTRSYPRAAQTIASAIPVLPLVGSTITERPGLISPSSSAASIIATPIRSLTEPPGLKYSSFAQTSAPSPSPSPRSATIGVSPTVAEASAAILIRAGHYRGLSRPQGRSGPVYDSRHRGADRANCAVGGAGGRLLLGAAAHLRLDPRLRLRRRRAMRQPDRKSP